MHFMHDARSVDLAELQKLAEARQLTGFFRVTDEDYHGGPGVSASGVCDFLRSPAHYRAAKARPKKSAAMELGTQAHEFLFQPERFHARYLVEPEGMDGPKTKNPWKAKWDEFKAKCEVEKKEPMDRERYRIVEGIARAVCDHPSGGQLLDVALFELAAYVQDPDTGFIRKAKADMALPWGIADLKTTDDARLEAFIRTIRAFHFHVKAAWYLDVFNDVMGHKPEHALYFDSFIWIAAEKAAPFGVACYAASPTMIENGRKTYQKAVEIMQTCIAKDVWPCYSGEIQAIELPDFAYRSADIGN